MGLTEQCRGERQASSTGDVSDDYIFYDTIRSRRCIVASPPGQTTSHNRGGKSCSSFSPAQERFIVPQ